MARLNLEDVTLCAVTSINVDQTLSALERSSENLAFGKALLLTDAPNPFSRSKEISVVRTPRIRSSLEYSRFVIQSLPDYIETDFILLIQWDGFVLNPDLWDPSFRKYDYIGASWPQFQDAYCVGNGGFSWRSRRLLEACRDPRFQFRHPEDVCICRDNRDFLEKEFETRFAEKNVADRFSFERHISAERTFGFHGVFNVIRALGVEDFWSLYQGLDDKSTVFVDYGNIAKSIIKEVGGLGLIRTTSMIFILTKDYISHKLSK